MKFTTKELQTTAKAIETITTEAREHTSVREALLFCDLMDRKKGEIYQEVLDGLAVMYNREVVREGNSFKVVYYARNAHGAKLTDSNGKAIVTNVLEMIIAEFPEYPKKEVVKDGVTTHESYPFTAALKQVSLDKERLSKGERPMWTEEQTRCISAINRFSAFASKAHLDMIQNAISEAVNKEVEAKVEAHIERAEKEGLEILPAKLEKDKEEIVASVKKKFKGNRDPRINDQSGNIKEKVLEEMPEQSRLALVKSIVKLAPEAIEKELTRVTGREVKHAPKIEEMRASALLNELENRLSSDFKEPKKAVAHINALRALLIEVVEPVSTPSEKAA